MRLWTLHPRYLDARGLVALWREALLAQKMLVGATTGYRHRPQLERFRLTPAPAAAIDAYLMVLAVEAANRGYRFNRGKIGAPRFPWEGRIAAPRGQLEYEWAHLLEKLERRAPDRYRAAT